MGKKKVNKSQSKGKQTPLMQQYNEVKAAHPDALLLFRVGDFYETFGADAIKAADTLGIVLTKRNNGGSDIELAGFPHHSIDLYLPRLVRAGFRVAICEQLEKPSKEKKIVKRGITEIVTPGIVFSDGLLDHRSNNFLAALHVSGHENGLAIIDVSTGEFFVAEGKEVEIKRLVQSLSPAEILVSRTEKSRTEEWLGADLFYYHLEPWVFTENYAIKKLKDHFQVESLKGYGIDNLETAQIAAGAIIEYLATTQNRNLSHINDIKRLHTEDAVWLDDFTIRNLELVSVQNGQGLSLKDVLDRTISPMGSRLLSKWILLPLINLQAINRRHSIVEQFVNQDIMREEVIDLIRKIGDLERLAGRIPQNRITPREIGQLKRSLDVIEPLKKAISEIDNKDLNEVAERLRICKTLRNLIGESLSDDPPALVQKGNVIRDGYNKELDELRYVVKNSKGLLLDIQKVEAEQTGIQNLKIGFNNVFGYYLEVTNKYKDKGLIPDNWVRKQTLTGSERYITDELKKLELKILTAEEKIGLLEERLYIELIQKIQNYIEDIQTNAAIIAEIDCLISFAIVALHNDYHRPVMDESNILDIKDGRHPVIEETMPKGEKYVANNTLLDPDQTQIMMITGPNMSGKSALLRQTALIVLMAQMGSFVPASAARIGIVDKVFTRVGASDNISSGESTFMIEMNETSSIMNNLSDRSLILLDEIGRGTSTFDGISIAWALAEYLHDHANARPKTLFATHYHELNDLAETYDRIANYNVSTKRIGQKVVFLRKLVEGGAEHSFGIHVAKMAGMPHSILARAEEVLKQLESKSLAGESKSPISKTERVQLSIFDASNQKNDELIKALERVEPNTMTPIECMLKLVELKKRLDDE